MDPETAHEIQKECLGQMKKGGLAPIERMDCFDKFETTNPNAELVKDSYYVWASNYDSDMKVADYHNPVDVANELAKLFPDDKETTIDIGAGTGEGGRLIVEKGFTNIDATDGSPGMLSKAEKLGVYKNILPAEVLIEGQTMKTVEPEMYDMIVSSGSFYPFHLQGEYLKCFFDCVKTGGHLVISSCPHDDTNVGLKPVIKKELEEAGVIEFLKEVFIPSWYHNDAGTLFVLKKLKCIYED
jgi:cyclopropane fatty-acyl-phospholipid synthase-like methyltransferase